MKHTQMKYYLLILLVSVANICFSQQKESIGLSLGPSIPLGDFANKYPDKNSSISSGYATLGFAIDFTYSRLVYKNYGLVGSIYFQVNPTDHQHLVDELSQQTPGAGSIMENSWNTGGVFLGVCGSYILTEKLRFEPQLLFGYNRSESQGFKAYNLDGPGGYPWRINQDITHSMSAFMFLARAVFKYDLGSSLCVLTNFDFFSTNPEFEYRGISTNFGTEYDTFTQKIRAFNFSIGVGYKF